MVDNLVKYSKSVFTNSSSTSLSTKDAESVIKLLAITAAAVYDATTAPRIINSLPAFVMIGIPIGASFAINKELKFILEGHKKYDLKIWQLIKACVYSSSNNSFTKRKTKEKIFFVILVFLKIQYFRQFVHSRAAT